MRAPAHGEAPYASSIPRSVQSLSRAQNGRAPTPSKYCRFRCALTLKPSRSCASSRASFRRERRCGRGRRAALDERGRTRSDRARRRPSRVRRERAHCKMSSRALTRSLCTFSADARWKSPRAASPPRPAKRSANPTATQRPTLGTRRPVSVMDEIANGGLAAFDHPHRDEHAVAVGLRRTSAWGKPSLTSRFISGFAAATTCAWATRSGSSESRS